MSFEQFAKARVHMLLRTAMAMCGDRALAEDLVQEVLLKTHLNWDRIKDLDVPDAYVRRMLVNEYLSWRRRWSKPPRSPQLADVMVADHADVHAERDALQSQISRLPRQQRVVIALRYYADLSDVEIADAIGCRPVTVRGYASRALAALRADTQRSRDRMEGQQR